MKAKLLRQVLTRRTEVYSRAATGEDGDPLSPVPMLTALVKLANVIGLLEGERKPWTGRMCKICRLKMAH